MQILIAALWGFLASAMGTMVGKVLLSLGIGYASYSAIDTSIGWARDFVISHISAMGGNTLAVAQAMQVGTCISILTSALVVRMTLAGMQAGVVKRMQVK